LRPGDVDRRGAGARARDRARRCRGAWPAPIKTRQLL